MTKKTGNLEGLREVESLDHLARREVGLRLFGLDLLGAGNITALEKDTDILTRYRQRRVVLEKANRELLSELYEAAANAALEPKYRLGLLMAGEETVLSSDKEKAERLLRRSVLSDEKMRELWGKPNPSTMNSKKITRRSNPADIPTTLYWFREAIEGRGKFDHTHFNSEERELEGHFFPEALQEPYDMRTPGTIPFLTLRRQKSRVSRNLKALRNYVEVIQNIRTTADADKQHPHWPHLIDFLGLQPGTTTLSAETRKMLSKAEQHWDAELQRRIIESEAKGPFGTKVNDIGGISIYYPGGHVPSDYNDITRAVDRFRTSNLIATNYRVVSNRNDYVAPHVRLHRFKLTVEPIGQRELSRSEIIFVDRVHHVAEYEFGPHPHRLHETLRDRLVITPRGIDKEQYRRKYESVIRDIKDSRI